jgi:hypothetical protein
MQPSTQCRVTRGASRFRRGRFAFFLAWLAACGGTTGLENLHDSSPSSADPPADPRPDGDDEGGVDASDAAVYDRSVPQRPPPQDTGAPKIPDAAMTRGVVDAGTSPAADTGPATTISVLAGQSSQCLTLAPDGATGGCAGTNGCIDPALQGGVCETVPGIVARGHGISEAQLCIQTLQDIFSSKCAAGGSETPCLCGDTSAMACVGGTATPTGPVYPDYVEDFGPNINAIGADFTLPAYGAGQANSIVQCLQIWQCQECFGNVAGDGGGAASEQ